MYLADYAQQYLVPVLGDGVPRREPLSVDDSTGGHVFRRVEVLRQALADGATRLWFPLIDGALVQLPACGPSRPLGLQQGPTVECETQLEPGDRVLLYTDGVVEARSPDGEFFGEERLADFVVRAEAAGDPPPETLRRLMRSVMDHQADRLQDDASIVLVEWRTDRHTVMRL